MTHWLFYLHCPWSCVFLKFLRCRFWRHGLHNALFMNWQSQQRFVFYWSPFRAHGTCIFYSSKLLCAAGCYPINRLEEIRFSNDVSLLSCFQPFWSMHREDIMAHLCLRHLSLWRKPGGLIQDWCLVSINWIKNNKLKYCVFYQLSLQHWSTYAYLSRCWSTRNMYKENCEVNKKKGNK